MCDNDLNIAAITLMDEMDRVRQRLEADEAKKQAKQKRKVSSMLHTIINVNRRKNVLLDHRNWIKLEKITKQMSYDLKRPSVICLQGRPSFYIDFNFPGLKN